jgi:hypothetical protein
MRTLGRNAASNYIVEMTPKEHEALFQLARSLQGNFVFTDRTIPDGDLSEVLRVINRFTVAKEYINGLKLMVTRLDETLMDEVDGNFFR